MALAVIFDIDGTLLDSVDLHAQAWQEAFLHFGHELDFSEIRSQIGKGGDQLLPVFLTAAEVKAKGKQLEEFRSRLFKEKYLAQVKPFPEVRELFQKLKNNGQRVGLASSAKGDELKIYERIANIEDLVEVGTSSADAERSKPHPDIFEAAFEKLGGGMRKEDVIIVGDSPFDAQAAGKAGIKIVGVRCGGFPEAVLLSAGCIAVYDSPADLLRQYSRSPLSRSTYARVDGQDREREEQQMVAPKH